MRPELNQEYLRKILTYDPESGHFKWNFNKGARNKSPYAGTQTSYGYIKILIDQKQYFAHRLAWLYVHGHWPEGFIDHINGDKADNRLVNLREAKREENCGMYPLNQQTPAVTSGSALISVMGAGERRSRLTGSK